MGDKGWGPVIVNSQNHFYNRDRAHERKTPSARGIRRSCNKELYRTVKRLNVFIPPEKMQKAERLYFKKVAYNLQWIVDNGNNRKKLADWWAEEVAPEIAEIWEIDQDRLVSAFRSAFGG